MHSNSDNIKIMISDEADEITRKNFLIHLNIDTKIIYNRCEVVSLPSIMFS